MLKFIAFILLLTTLPCQASDEGDHDKIQEVVGTFYLNGEKLNPGEYTVSFEPDEGVETYQIFERALAHISFEEFHLPTSLWEHVVVNGDDLYHGTYSVSFLPETGFFTLEILDNGRILNNGNRTVQNEKEIEKDGAQEVTVGGLLLVLSEEFRRDYHYSNLIFTRNPDPVQD